jgi:hypothetical protein
MLQQVPLSGSDAVSAALAGTALEGATGVVVDYAAGTFRIVHPDANKDGRGRIVSVDGGWAISEFSFSVDGKGATLSLDPSSRQIISVATTEGHQWKPSGAASERSATRSDIKASFESANAELLGQEASLATKNESSFIAPIFFFIAFYWLLCADGYLLICPGFGSLLALFAALLPLFGPPAPPAPTPDPPAPVNNAPTAQADAFTINQGETATGNVLSDNGSGADSDPDGDTLTVALVTGPSNGTLDLQATGAFTFTPTSIFSGVVTFVYQISDGNGGTSNATVTVTVVQNNPPLALDDDFETNNQAPPLTGNLFVTNGNGADSDPDGDPFTVVAVDALASNVGVAIVTSGGALVTVLADGSMTYNDNGAFDFLPVGTVFNDTFTYTISDGVGGSSTAMVTIMVTVVNNP